MPRKSALPRSISPNSPKSDSPNNPKSISPRRNRDPPRGYKISPRSPPESPATEPISPEELSKMIALFKQTIPNKDVLEVVIDELKKKVVKQRIKWEKLKNKKYFDISTLKYGPRGYN